VKYVNTFHRDRKTYQGEPILFLIMHDFRFRIPYSYHSLPTGEAKMIYVPKITFYLVSFNQREAGHPGYYKIYFSFEISKVYHFKST